MENLANQAVDRLWLELLVGQVFVIEQLLASIDRSMIRLVVDHKEWEFGNDLSPGLLVR